MQHFLYAAAAASTKPGINAHTKHNTACGAIREVIIN
jgi:hypothetical protein